MGLLTKQRENLCLEECDYLLVAIGFELAVSNC